MRILNSRENIEDKETLEREQQVEKLIMCAFCFECERKPGEFIKRYGSMFSRLNEFKSEDFSERKNYLKFTKK